MKIRNFALSLMMLPLLTGASAKAENVTIQALYASQSGYQEDELKALASLFKDLTGIGVKIVMTDPQQRLQNIADPESAYDVITFDQLQLAALTKKGLLAPLDDYLTAAMRKDLAPALLKAFKDQKKTWGVPFLVNVQLFFYNEAMLEKVGLKAAPATLEEMAEQMTLLKKKGVAQHPWTDAWRQSEGLVAEFTWLIGAFGGELFDEDGKPAFDDEAGLRALEFMVMLIEKELVDPNILTNDEIAAKDAFLRGDAAFTSNWAFLAGLLHTAADEEIKDQAKAALLPVSRTIAAKSSTVAALQGIGIAAKSAQKDAAWKWVQFFTSPLTQRAYAAEIPVWTSAQTNGSVNFLDPTMSLKRTQLETAHFRPKLANYAEVSAILQRTLYAALTQELTPSDALKTAAAEIKALAPKDAAEE